MDSNNSSKNELHHQKHPPTVQSPEQVWIFSSSSSSSSTEAVASGAPTAVADMEDDINYTVAAATTNLTSETSEPSALANSEPTTSASVASATSLLLKDRWQHLKQQAAEHVLLQNVTYVAPPIPAPVVVSEVAPTSSTTCPTTEPVRPWTVAAALRPRLVLPSTKALRMWSPSSLSSTSSNNNNDNTNTTTSVPPTMTANTTVLPMDDDDDDNNINNNNHQISKEGAEDFRADASSETSAAAEDYKQQPELSDPSKAPDQPLDTLGATEPSTPSLAADWKQPDPIGAAEPQRYAPKTEDAAQTLASSMSPPPPPPTKAAPVVSNHTNNETPLYLHDTDDNNDNNNNGHNCDPISTTTTIVVNHHDEAPAQLYATCPSSTSSSHSNASSSSNNSNHHHQTGNNSGAEEHSREDSQSRSLQSSNSSSCISSSDDDDVDNDDNDDESRAMEYNAAPTSTIHNSHNSRIALPSSWRTSAAAAAALMVDSATTTAAAAVVFRGRYNNSNNSNSNNNDNSINSIPEAPAVESNTTTTATTQAARIGQSKRTQEHWHQLTNQLPPYQYVVLLGRGRFGVHLKQCYKLAQGVYVDELVPGGNAAQAGNVQIGDVMMAIGGTSCCGIKSCTIATVPQQIADATPRPVHLILATSGAIPTPVVAPNATTTTISLANTESVPMNHIDVAVAVFLFQQEQQHEQKEEPLPIPNVLQWNKNDDNDDRWMTGWLNPGVPPTPVRRFYESWATHRNTDIVVGTSSATEMCQVALGNALLLCLADPRRFPFVARAFGAQSPLPSPESPQHTTSTNDESTAATTKIVANTPHSLLILLYDLTQYLQLYPLLSAAQRYERALALARLYFLPTTGGASGVFRPPPRDWHTLVPATALRRLEVALQQQPPPRQVFGEFHLAAWEVMTSAMFGPGFLAGHVECARMRAYLRHTAPYRNAPLDVVVNGIESDSHAHNYFLYTLLYTLTKTDLDEQMCNFGENDEIVLESSGPVKRVRTDGDGIVAALFVRHRLLPALLQQQQFNRFSQEESDAENLKGLELYRLEQFWQHFLAPQIGALAADDDDDYGDDDNDGDGNDSTRTAIVKTTRRLQEALQRLSRNPSDASLRNSLIKLLETWSNDLIYDWACRVHPQFCRHKFHEWWCVEVAAHQQQQENNQELTVAPIETMPPLPRGCIVRLLRHAHMPMGVTPHKPLHVDAEIKTVADSTVVVVGSEASSSLATSVPLQWHAAECAVVFGTRVNQDNHSGNSNMAPIAMPGMDPNGDKKIGRLTCQSVVLDNNSSNNSSIELPPFCLSPEEIPLTLESYAVSSSPFLRKQTLDTGTSSSSFWQSADGWQVQLVNVWVPRADAGEGSAKFLFGVALILTQPSYFNKRIPVETEWDIPDDDDGDGSNGPFRIATTGNGVKITSRLRILSKLPVLHYKLSAKPSWSQQVFAEQEAAKPNNRDYHHSCITMGLMLVSQRNVVLAMRETLSALLLEYCPGPDPGKPGYCGPLVDLLGSLRQDDVETNALRCILDPFTRRAVQSWLERPIGSQKESFLQVAGRQLVRCLPPIPLALAFLTALLEQKMVLCSSRQSVLISATTVLSELLQPLQWCHLLVPRVPASLAGDLLQYPAPFILGVSSTDPGVMDLIRQLPDDITLVDLDVGRVILAPLLSHHQANMTSADSAAAATRLLRSQVLHLAQNLGSVFGRHIDPDTWACDHPWPTGVNQCKGGSQWDRLQTVAHDFVQELLAGTASCCYWVEEAFEDSTGGASGITTTPTVFFDEDRFFQIKDAREQYGSAPLFHGGGSSTAASSCNPLSLSLHDANLVLELFLRCQSMNEYIGTRQRDEMFFSL